MIKIHSYKHAQVIVSYSPTKQCGLYKFNSKIYFYTESMIDICCISCNEILFALL